MKLVESKKARGVGRTEGRIRGVVVVGRRHGYGHLGVRHFWKNALCGRLTLLFAFSHLEAG